MKLKDRVAIITDRAATSGEAAAKLFASEGAKIMYSGHGSGARREGRQRPQGPTAMKPSTPSATWPTRTT